MSKTQNNQQAVVLSKPPTMADIASKLGVTKMTVSYALNGSPQVSQSMRETVLLAAKEMGYSPNAVAQSLKSRRTNAIGFYFVDKNSDVIDFRNEFVGEVLYGVQSACVEHGKHMLLHGSFKDFSVDEICAELTNGRVDGVLVLAAGDDSVAARLAESNLPAIAIADEIGSLPSVVVDEKQGAALLIEHLRQKRHHKVFYLTQWPAPLHQAAVERKNQFVKQAQQAEIEVDELEIGSGDFYPSAQDVAEFLKKRIHQYSAGIAWADGTADLLLEACEILKVRVPHDLAVMGFNGCKNHRRLAYNLTTVCAGWEEVAKHATHLLIQRIEGKEIARQTILPVELTQGNTT